jgi:hypothetical protein
MSPPTFAILIVCFASIAVADDIKTLHGKEYKNATVSRVEPDGIVIKFTGGIVKLAFVELPEETRNKYGYRVQAAQARPTNQTQADAQVIDKWNAEVRRIQEGREKYRNVPRYTLHELEMSQFYLIGQTIIADFNYRGDDTKRIDDEWFEGYIWLYAPGQLLRQSQEGTRVLFSKAGLAWYQALPTKSPDVLSFSIFARVEENRSGGTFLRLLGTEIRPDKDGIREIVW